MTEALLLGLLIGVLLGLLGGGGSILAVPALPYGVGLPLPKAIPTSRLVVAVSSLTAVLLVVQVLVDPSAVTGTTG